MKLTRKSLKRNGTPHSPLIMTLMLILANFSACNVYVGHNRIVSENSFDDLNYVIDVTNTSVAKVRLRYRRISTGNQELPMEDYLYPGSSMRLKVKREGLNSRVQLGLEEETISYELEFKQAFRPFAQDIKEWVIDNNMVTSVLFHPVKSQMQKLPPSP